MKPTGGMILKNIPDLAPEGLPVYLGVTSQKGFKAGDPVPGTAEKIFLGHARPPYQGHQAQSLSRNHAKMGRVQISISSRSSTLILPTPSMPGLRSGDRLSSLASTRK